MAVRCEGQCWASFSGDGDEHTWFNSRARNFLVSTTGQSSVRAGSDMKVKGNGAFQLISLSSPTIDVTLDDRSRVQNSLLQKKKSTRRAEDGQAVERRVLTISDSKESREADFGCDRWALIGQESARCLDLASEIHDPRM